MCSKTLKVKKANAVTAYNNATTDGKKLLSNLFGEDTFNLDVFSLTTFEQVCEVEGVDPAKYELPADADDEEVAVNAYRKLLLIYKVFRKEWIPNYNNSNQYKFYPYFRWDSSAGRFVYAGYVYDLTGTDVGARLSVDSAEKAKHIGTHFVDIYNDFLTLKTA